MTHPSMEGLREAVAKSPCTYNDMPSGPPNGACSYQSETTDWKHPECAIAAIAAYLREHGVACGIEWTWVLTMLALEGNEVLD